MQAEEEVIRSYREFVSRNLDECLSEAEKIDPELARASRRVYEGLTTLGKEHGISPDRVEKGIGGLIKFLIYFCKISWEEREILAKYIATREVRK